MSRRLTLKPKMRPFVLAAMLALSAGGLSQAIHASSEGNEEAREAFTQAQQFMDRGDARSARIELMNAIKADPALD